MSLTGMNIDHADKRAAYLKVAEVNHPIHHLANTEAVTKVVEGVIAVVFLNSQLEDRDSFIQFAHFRITSSNCI